MPPTVRELFDTLDWGPAPESDAPARAWVAEHGPDFGLFIGGKMVSAASGERFPTFNPATAQPIATLAQAGAAEVDAAVASALAAQPGWAALGGPGRARYLYALARHVQKQHRLFATLETLDNGKPLRETRDIDVPLVVRHFYHHAGWAQLFETEFADYEPVGVCGQIIPWNFPLLMLAWKVAPALAAGNTVVLKPAELTSLSALLFAQLCQAVGLPPGVVNILTGDGRAGELIVQHPSIDKLAFTGSTEVGRLIRQATAGSGKQLTLELGGKSPFVVFDDADLDSAIEGVVDAIWFNQGQVCCAGSRLLVQESIAEPFYQRLRERMERLRVGNPFDKAVDMGAITAPEQLARISRLCATGEADGATRWQPSWALPREGWWYPPTLFTDVAPASAIAQEEIFGPVLVAMTFRSPDEAVALANNTPYGLAASVWSEDVNVALDVARRVKAGTVWVNSTNLFDAAAGFGGYRASGFGREGGREGLYAYVRRAGWPFAVTTPRDGAATTPTTNHPAPTTGPGLDRTAKLYIGGRQVRPDGGYSWPVHRADGSVAGLVGAGNRKDLRNAVEAASAAGGRWAGLSGHARAQVLYYLAENLAARAADFAARIADLTGEPLDAASAEVAAAVNTWLTWAAWADKWDGAVHDTTLPGLVLALHEPVGVAAVVCPDAAPLLALSALVGALVAAGNSVVALPSPRWPLVATDFYQVLDTSDLPPGVVNLVTGDSAVLVPVLADHDAVDLLWHAGPAIDGADVERRSAGNLKRTWLLPADSDWARFASVLGRDALRQATQVKNLWIPHGT